MNYFIKLNLFIILSFLFILNQKYFSSQQLKLSDENYRGNLISVPELYERPCSYASRNTGSCNYFEIEINPVYNSDSDPKYISGYQPMIFGIPVFITYERTGNKKFKVINKKWF